MPKKVILNSMFWTKLDQCSIFDIKDAERFYGNKYQSMNKDLEDLSANFCP